MKLCSGVDLCWVGGPNTHCGLNPVLQILYMEGGPLWPEWHRDLHPQPVVTKLLQSSQEVQITREEAA